MCMICSVPAYRFCSFQSGSHLKIQRFSYILLDTSFIWITLQGQYIQSRGFRRSYWLHDFQEFTLGVKLSIALLLSQLWKPLWTTSALELFSQRESPQKHQNSLKKERQTKPSVFSSLWKRHLSQKGFILEGNSWTLAWLLCLESQELGLCSWPRQRPWRWHRLVLRWVHKGSCFDHKRIVFLTTR